MAHSNTNDEYGHSTRHLLDQLAFLEGTDFTNRMGGEIAIALDGCATMYLPAEDMEKIKRPIIESIKGLLRLRVILLKREAADIDNNVK